MRIDLERLIGAEKLGEQECAPLLVSVGPTVLSSSVPHYEAVNALGVSVGRRWQRTAAVKEYRLPFLRDIALLLNTSCQRIKHF